MRHRRWHSLPAPLLLIAAFLFASAASQAEGATGGRPNILLVLTDDQTYESLAQMPYTNGRSDWTRFDRAFVNNPLCCPSRASILTGKYSHHTGVEGNYGRYPRRFKDRSTIGTWLRRSGYRTGFIGKYLNGYPWKKAETYVPPGWDRWIGLMPGPWLYYDYRLNIDGEIRSFGYEPHEYSTDLYTDYALGFIENSRRPFYLQVNYSAPHEPDWEAPRHTALFRGTPSIAQSPSFNEADVSDKPSFVRRLPLSDETEMARERRGDYRQLVSVDESMERLFDRLQSTGKLQNTIVAFTSDNGFALGEHRVYGKRCPYEQCIRVPFLIRFPGVAGGTDHALVSNVDLAPTFAARARVDPPPVDGGNLAPLISNRKRGVRKAVLIRNLNAPNPFSRYPTYWGVRTGRFKYVEYRATREKELYDLRSDPHELNNLAGRAGLRRVQRRLARKLRLLREARPK